MAVDPTVVSALTSALEAAANRALEYDPSTQNKIKAFNQHILKIESTEPNLALYFTSEQQHVRFSAYGGTEPDATISGPLIKLLSLKQASPYSLADSGVRVTGKMQVVGDFQTILRNIEIDWEAIISDWVGDVAGHQIAKIAKGLSDWAQTTTQKLPARLPEFLQEELRLVPTEYEMKYFSEQVDELRAAVDRVKIRVNNLTNSQNNTQ